MKQAKLNELSYLECITPNVNRSDIHGIFACDMLSHVMGFAENGNMLITVLSNMNVLGVADLLDLSGVIFTNGVPVDKTIVKKANDLNIPLYTTTLSTAQIVIKLHELGAED